MVTAPSRISVSALVIAPSIYSLSHCHDSYLSPTSLFPLSIPVFLSIFRSSILLALSVYIQFVSVIFPFSRR